MIGQAVCLVTAACVRSVFGCIAISVFMFTAYARF